MPITVSGTTITFNDATTQTTAGITSAVTSLNGSTGAITNTGFNNIGSYSCGRGAAGTGYSPGATLAGSSLAQISVDNQGPFNAMQSDIGVLVGSNRGQTGTWRAMAASGGFSNEGTSYTASNLWVRIS